MPVTDTFVLGADPQGQPVSQALRLTNRHGLVAGATRTGKTVTLQRLAELFSDAGVAVFAADIKGDLCGLGAAGNPQGKVAERIAGMPWLHHQPQAYPVTLWDVAGKSGHPLRTTLSEMGPLLLSNLLELTDSQQAALYAAFQVADREGLLLLDLKDLKALLNHLKDNPEMLGEDRALFAGASSQALLRRLATLEQQGAEALFGEPALQLEDILRPDADGRGRIHLLDASRLVHEAPKVYATFLLWLLAELFEQLPERGDADKPVLALFFDEAHLLFADTPKALQERLQQVVRLIRSKGVGSTSLPSRPATCRMKCWPSSVCVFSMDCAPSPPRNRSRCVRWPMVSVPIRRSTASACSPNWASAKRWSAPRRKRVRRPWSSAWPSPRRSRASVR